MNQPEFFTLGKKVFQKYPHFHELSRQCHDLLDAVSVNANQRQIVYSGITAYQDILAKEFQRSWSSFNSLLILCDNGQMWDARTICRKLWETAITLKYISLDPEKYVRLYKNFGLLSYERQFDRLPACMKDGDEVKRMHEAYSSRVAELPDYRRDENGRIQKNFYSYWSGKNLHDMAVDGKVDEIYSPRAFVLHNSTHINTIGSDAFFESDTLKYGPPDQDRDLPMLVCEACHYMLMVASLVCEAHEFKLKESCDSFRRAIEQLLPEALDVAFGARSDT